jgi:DNA-binding XRE family transcriptional regulator
MFSILVPAIMGKAKHPFSAGSGSQESASGGRRSFAELTRTEVIAHRALASRTRELRKAKGWSQNQLADFAGVARGYLSHILAGEYSPTLRILARLADALEVQVKDLFG